ncbi:MAG: hypothetical protein RIQ54_260 [Candidatus Parcubacteria bacterium]|jgi:arginyl-tRNA synthetase
MTFPDVTSLIASHIRKALDGLGFSVDSFSLEHPADVAFGDYATNVALVVAHRTQQTPRAVADAIVRALPPIEWVDRIEIAGPGFINFYLSRSFFVSCVDSVIADRGSWGRNGLELNEEVLFEYTSPNLFKPLHVGNLVGNIIGESLSRLHEFSGATVRRINYPSDIGLTVAKGVWGIMKTNGNPDVIDDLGSAYIAGNNAYESGGDEKNEIEAVNRALYAGTDERLNAIRDRGIQTSRARISQLCSLLGTSFDKEIFESQAAIPAVTVVQSALASGVFEKSDGAVVYHGERIGLHTRVFLNSQGLPTYEAKDLGNFKIKQDYYPDWTRCVVVTGSEQKEYFKVVIAAICDVFPDARNKSIEHVPTGFLTLTTGKMSSRKGNVLTGESLIEQLRTEALERAKDTRTDNVARLADVIAVGALKYQILRQKVGTNIIFDKQQALSFEGDSGPYLQYTHARTVSVLEKADSVHLAPSTAHSPEHPYPIERLLYQFPEVTQRALSENSPHYIVSFLSELAGMYNAFYALERIADVRDEYAPYKIALTDAVRATLAQGLYVLGIEAPDKM